MRRFIPILATLAVIVAVFVLYLRQQPTYTLVVPQPPPPAATSPSTQSSGVAGPGTSGWIMQYTADTGERSYGFRADEYDPQPDGRWLVAKPVIEFYPRDGEVVRVEGSDGVVRMPPGADRSAMIGAPVGPPRSGQFRNVIVRLFRSAELTRDAKNAELTVTMDNARFDTDSYRLATEAETGPDGRTIAADQIPVIMHGEEADFFGHGLVMDWNDRDHRLQLLEIAHGDRLIIHHADNFLGPAPQASPPPVAAAPPARGRRPSQPPATGPGQPAAPSLYRATFLQDVRVDRGGFEVARGSEMDVDFALKSQSAGPPTANAATAPSNALNPTANATGSAAAAPPDDQVVQVFWQGTLRMVPAADLANPARTATGDLPDGQAIVRLIGAPVLLHAPPQNASAAPATPPDVDASAAELDYRTVDGIAHLLGNDAIPVVMTQKRADGTTAIVTGADMQYSRIDNLAKMTGHGDAVFPDPADPTSILHATWDRDALVHLTSTVGGPTQITGAELNENVVVHDPRFDLSSHDLTLAFASPTANADQPTTTRASSPQLTKIVATGDAKCTVHEADGRARTIDAQQLQLLTAHDAIGRLFARTVLADGAVFAQQDEDKLHSDHLTVTLRPAANGAATQTSVASGSSGGDVELEQMLATGNVRVDGKDGSHATGDKLTMTSTPDHSTVGVLIGGLKSPAKVVNKDSTITGPEIDFAPREQTSSVVGAGTLDTVQQSDDPKRPPRPLHVIWTRGADLNGITNRVLARGGVQALTSEPGGAVDVAAGDSMTLHLSPAPTSAAAPAAAATSRPTDGDFDFMRGRTVQSLTLQDNASLESSLKDANGRLLRDGLLIADRIDYDLIARQLTVPGHGRMALVEYPASTTRPAVAPAGAAAATGRGQTVFDWGQSMVYDEQTRTVTMKGQVKVIHQNSQTDTQPVRLDADTVTAEFAGAASTRPVNAAETPMDLRRMTASGKVTVKSGPRTIQCAAVEFDPTTNLLACHGGQGVVTVTDENTPNHTTFSDVWLNTKTNTIVKMTNVAAHGRQ